MSVRKYARIDLDIAELEEQEKEAGMMLLGQMQSLDLPQQPEQVTDLKRQ